MTVSTGSWVSEHCSSTGYDSINLIGAEGDNATFAAVIPAGQVWYSIKDGNGNTEAGIGDFDGAVTIARNFEVSERVISTTILAFGTSSPELITSMVAAFRKESDISVGNLIGSNIFNILAHLGFL